MLEPGGPYKGPVEVALKATDPDGAADLASTKYSLDRGPDTNYTEPFTVGRNGTHTIDFRSSDKGGHVEPLQSRTFNVQQDVIPSQGVLFQQGSKLVGDGAVGQSQQGGAVALSADGNTALVGGAWDSGASGATWVFVRRSGEWIQQGPKLVGTDGIGPVEQGTSVALSADGNTALIGGLGDNNAVGAAWVFVRSGGVWRQQGPKLVGSGAVGQSVQGISVALSADGNTALVGGCSDDRTSNTGAGAGAVWVFTRRDGVWTQQGEKLVGTGAVNPAQQGEHVAISADGNTAISGGWVDDNDAGAVWVFTRSGDTWTQQGPKLVGTTAGQIPRYGTQGYRVALSADGNTLIESGNGIWTFTRSGKVGHSSHNIRLNPDSDRSHCRQMVARHW